MQTVSIVFHGLFPAGPQPPGNPVRRLAIILLDVSYLEHQLSHITAELFLHDETDELEVQHELPFDSPQFAHAVVQYYQFILGPQSKNISHSGPKGSSLTGDDVIRAEWHISIKVPDEEWIANNSSPLETSGAR